MQEMVSMGIGSKPFMDIKPSDAAISDRAIDYIMKGSGELSVTLYFSLNRLTPLLSSVCCIFMIHLIVMGLHTQILTKFHTHI